MLIKLPNITSHSCAMSATLAWLIGQSSALSRCSRCALPRVSTCSRLGCAVLCAQIPEGECGGEEREGEGDVGPDGGGRLDPRAALGDALVERVQVVREHSRRRRQFHQGACLPCPCPCPHPCAMYLRHCCVRTLRLARLYSLAHYPYALATRPAPLRVPLPRY